MLGGGLWERYKSYRDFLLLSLCTGLGGSRPQSSSWLLRSPRSPSRLRPPKEPFGKGGIRAGFVPVCDRDPRGEWGRGCPPHGRCKGDKAAGWDRERGPASRRRAPAGRKPIPKAYTSQETVLSPPNPQALSWLLHFGVRALMSVPGKSLEQQVTRGNALVFPLSFH